MSLDLPDVNAISPKHSQHIHFLDYHLAELTALYGAKCDEYDALIESGESDPDNENQIWLKDENDAKRCIELEEEVAEIAVAIHDFGEAALKYVTVDTIHTAEKPPEQFIKIFLYNTDGYFDFSMLDIIQGTMYADNAFEGISSVDDLRSEKGLELLVADNPDESVFLVTTPVKHTPIDSLLVHSAYLMRGRMFEQYPHLRKAVQGPKSLMCKVQKVIEEAIADGINVEISKVETYHPMPPQNPDVN